MAVAPEVIDYYRSITDLDATALAPLCEPAPLAVDGMNFPLSIHTLEAAPREWRTMQEKQQTPLQGISDALGVYMRRLVGHVIPEETWGDMAQAALDDFDPMRHGRSKSGTAIGAWALFGHRLSKDQLIGKKYATGNVLGITIGAVAPPASYNKAYTAEPTAKNGYRFSDPAFFFVASTEVKSGPRQGTVTTNLIVRPVIVYNTAHLPQRTFRVHASRRSDTLAQSHNRSALQAVRRASMAAQHPWRGGDCTGGSR